MGYITTEEGGFNVEVAAAGDTLQQDLGAINNDYNQFQAYYCLGSSFTASSGYTVTRVDVELLTDSGAPFSSAVTAYITADCTLSDTAAILATSTATHQYTLTGSEVYYQWDFAGYLLTNAVRYCIALCVATQDGTNDARWPLQKNGITESQRYNNEAAAVGTWGLVQATAQGTMKIYGH